MPRGATFGILLAFTAQAASATPRILAVDVDGVVHPITARIVAGALSQAQQQHAELLLVRLNTPGGSILPVKEMIAAFRASPVPVATYVAPAGGRAWDAGFLLLEAGDVAAMVPGTTIGAAHAAASFRRSLTAPMAHQNQSFTEREALDQHLIDQIASNQQQFMIALNGRTVTRADGRSTTLHTDGAMLETYQLSLRERIVTAIADPNIAFLLLVVGALAIYLEFNMPGLIVPGAVGALLVLLGLSALSVLPLDWRGASLLLLSFGLFALEAKFASHGIFGLGGAAAMVLGAVTLVDSPLPELQIHWAAAIALTVPFAAITVALLSLAVRAGRNKRETLNAA